MDTEFAMRTSMLAKYVEKFGESWLELTKAADMTGLTIEEMDAKKEMDEAIRKFILLNQKRIRLAADTLREQRERRENEDKV